jgi:hypothetical protein
MIWKNGNGFILFRRKEQTMGMGRIVKPGRRVTVVQYYREFVWKDEPGAGFSFQSDPAGNVDTLAHNPGQREQFKRCLQDPNLIDKGVRRYEWVHWDPAQLECDCGTVFALTDVFLSTCPACGADYNGSGQRLAPRSQWGEETGESLGDILTGGW